MRILQRTSLTMLVGLAAASACVIPTVSLIDPAAQATAQALTVEAAIRGTQQAGSSPTVGATVSLTDTSVPTNTLTPSITPPPSTTPTLMLTTTAFVIPSSTAIVPSISVSVPTNCRAGPGRDYEIEGALLVGKVAQVLGRDPSNNYWYIPNPDLPGDYCWVWGEYAILSGYMGGVPMLTPPPTPTATATSTPMPGFEATYGGFLHCGEAWWVQLELDNTGFLEFRSIEIVLRDTELGTTEILEADGFFYRESCSDSSTRVSLQPGKTLTVTSPTLDNNPNSHRLRATITACSKEGLEGGCVTKTVRFTP